MTSKLAVLLTNAWLDRRGGTETAIRDVALGLLRRGHRPIVYSPHPGEPAAELHRRGVAVIAELSRLAEPPDVIHGQHFVQTAEAIIRFPQTPAIQTCHAWQFWQERPADFPEVHRYLAVDETVRDRLVHMDGIEPARVEVVLNAVDLRRAPRRTQPLARRPIRALAFTKNSAHLPLLQAVCRRQGVELDVLGAGGDRVIAHPERELVRYDLVFATARMALEALCAGCAVIVCDARGLAGMVTTAELPRLRPLNFGLRCLTEAVTEEALSAALARYDPHDAESVATQVRATASLETLLDLLEARYQAAIAAPPPTLEQHRAALLRFLHQALPRQRNDGRWPWMAERRQMEARIEQLERAVARTHAAILESAAPAIGPAAESSDPQGAPSHL